MIDACIDLKVVELALISRKIAASQNRVEPGKGCRWAAMSAHTYTGDCEQRSRPIFRWVGKSMLTPLQAGYIHRIVEQVRLREGLDAVRKTWGKGYRAMQADTAKPIVR